MSTVLQKVDPDNFSTVQFDFYDETGVNNKGGLKTFLRGDFDDGDAVSPSNVSGLKRTRREERPRQVKFSIRSKQSSMDGFWAAAAELFHHLEDWALNGGVLKRTLHGATEPFYYTVITCSAPGLLRAQPLALYEITRLLDDVKGLPITLTVAPSVRGALLDSDTNKAPQDTGIVDSNDDGTPDSLSFDATTNVEDESIQTDTESFQFVVNTVTERLLSQTYDANASLTGQSWCVSFEAKLSGVSQVGARITYLDSAGAVVGSSTDSALSTPTDFSDPDAPANRIYVTAVAPASAEQVRLSVRCANSGAGDGTYDVRRFQIEQGTTPSRFVCSTKTVNNDPATAYGRFAPVFIHGEEAPIEVTIAPTAGSVVEGVLAYKGSGGVDGGNSIADLLNRSGLVQFTGTGDANASGGSVGAAARKTITANLDSLRGAWRALARAPSRAEANEILLRWGASLQNPEPESNDIVSGIVATEDLDFDLGRVVIPESGSLEGVALKPTNISGSVALDYLLLVPTDWYARLFTLDAEVYSVPGGSGEGTGMEHVAGTETDDGNDLVLNADGEGGSAETTAIVGGRYRAAVLYSIRDAGGSTDLGFTFQHKTGPDVWANIATDTVTGAVDDENNAVVVLEATPGFTSVRVRPILTVANGATVTIHTATITHVPLVGSTKKVRVDGAWGADSEPRAMILNASDQFQQDMGGPIPVRAGPGLGALYSALYDVKNASDDTIPQSVLTRAWTQRVRYYPRYPI